MVDTVERLVGAVWKFLRRNVTPIAAICASVRFDEAQGTETIRGKKES